jgi:hypothetical protein
LDIKKYIKKFDIDAIEDVSILGKSRNLNDHGIKTEYSEEYKYLRKQILHLNMEIKMNTMMK